MPLTPMKQTLPKGAAKRLTFSLVLLSVLGGCAVYGPAPGPYAYGTDAYGQPIYSAPYYPYYNPYYYNPLYLGGPPVFFNFGFRGGRRDHDRGFRGDRDGGHGDRGGGMHGDRGGGGHGGGHR